VVGRQGLEPCTLGLKGQTRGTFSAAASRSESRVRSSGAVVGWGDATDCNRVRRTATQLLGRACHGSTPSTAFRVSAATLGTHVRRPRARRLLARRMYRGRVATRPVHRDSALQEAVNRAREAIAASGQLRPTPATYTSPLSEQERRAVATLLRDGTYCQLADAAAAVDPDIADL